MKTFRQALQGAAHPVTAELAGPAERNADEACRLARKLSHHVDAIEVTEHSTAAGVSPVALAALLLRDGIDPIPRISCVDRNRIALLSDLLGLRALGVTSVLLGSDGNGAPADSSSVLDVSGRELVAMASDINEEEWADSGHEILVGNSLDIPPPNGEWNLEELAARASAGVRFLQIRPGSDSELLRRFLEQLVEHRITWRCSVMVTVDLRQGIEACAGQIREAASMPGVSGFHLSATDDDAAVAAAISESGIR